MSFRPQRELSGNETPIDRAPEIQHPTPTRPPALQRRATIATETYEQHSAWSHSVAALDSPNSDRSEQTVEEHPATTTATNIQRPPSAPAVMDHPPIPPSTGLHSVLTVRPVLRTSPRSRTRLTWDVRFPPDAPPSALIPPGRCNNTVLGLTHGTRPRSNTLPTGLGQIPGPTLASDTRRRPSLDSNFLLGPSEGEPLQALTSHPFALEPATVPPRPRMLIICRDLMSWLIPIYASDLEVGCTILDVVRGIYEALQVKVEVPGHSRSASDGTRVVRERRLVDLLRDKTMFVCLGREEAVTRRCLPEDSSLWEETYMLVLNRRRK